MRKKEEIKKEMNQTWDIAHKAGRTAGYDDIAIELLLDIRQILIDHYIDKKY